MGKVKIKEIVEKTPGNLEPILLNFEHANIRNRCNEGGQDLNDIFATAVFKSEEVPTLEMPSLSARNSLKRKPSVLSERKVAVLQSSQMTYVGSTDKYQNSQASSFKKWYSSQSSQDSDLKTYIAIKKKKKMRLYEVTPITVAPYIPGNSYVEEEERDTSIQVTKEERKAAGVDLVKAFGSKRKRLTYERNEKNKIDVADMDQSISLAARDVEIPEHMPTTKDQSVLTLIPPCNREAKEVADVYKLEDLLTTAEMDDLEDMAEQFLNFEEKQVDNWRTSKRFSDYFCAMWRRLSMYHNAVNKKNAKLVIYTEVLIQLMKLKYDQLRKKMPPFPPEFPAWLVQKALDSFTIINANGVRNRSDACKDKTCCYIMVLVLLANDFVFDVQLMSTSLNVHIKKLLTLAKAVGITLNYNANNKEYRGILKVPLPKPIENRGRSRRLR